MSETPQSLGRQLFYMTWPMMFGVLALMSYQLVDSAFIGQLGVRPLAVVGFTIPIAQLIIGIQVGLGIATTAVISAALGAEKCNEARQLATLVVLSGFVLIAILALAIWFGRTQLLHLLGGDDSLLPLVRTYWLPWLISAWLGAMLYFGYSIFRANGVTMIPGMVMVVTSLVNVGLDPLFIFALDMGIAGAAWATICAFSLGCIVIYGQIFQRGWLEIPPSWQMARTGLARLYAFMAPAMVSQFIPPLSAIAATSIVAAYGESVVAAWGLGIRLEFFSIVAVLGLTMAMPPMIGRFRGAQDYGQIQNLIRIAVIFVLLWQAAVAVFWLSVSGILGQLLTSDAAIDGILQDYLWRVPLSYGPLGVCMVLVSSVNAMGMPIRALLISALRLLGCYLPCLWLGAEFGGVDGLFFGAMLGNFAAGMMAWWVYKTAMSQKIGGLNRQIGDCLDQTVK